MALHGAPPSPTLTDPDMILPWGQDYDDPTPSPPRDGAWTMRPQDMDFSQGLTFANGVGGMPMVPITPIIYGNGTMLSDIGEVTEAESTVPGIGARRMQSRLAKGGGTPYGSSPTVPHQSLMMKKKAMAQHKRSVSAESGSTVMTEEPTTNNMNFKDFDDTVSVDESAFAGDDEESIADYAFSEPMVAETRTLYGKRASRMIDMQKEKQEEELSSAALSRRAELILSNAKKRLDNMEGNLNRARNSLHITPSASMSSIHSSSPLARSTPSPPNQRNSLPASRHIPLILPQTIRHNRIDSESSMLSPVQPVPTSRTFLSGKPLDPIPRYSAPIRAESYDSSNSAPHLNSRNSDPSTTTLPRDNGSGSDSDRVFGRDRYVRAATAEPSYHHEIHRSSSRNSLQHGLERSSSTTDMRDVMDKMKDLKGKISTLRDRAREDHMKRRSASNLRTPSPFTAAEQWHTSSNDYKDGHLSANAGVAHVPWEETYGQEDEPPRDVLISENGRVADGIAEDYEPSEADTVYQDAHEVEEVQSEPSETYDNVATSFGDADPLNQRAVIESDESDGRNTPQGRRSDDSHWVEQGDQGYSSDGGESIYHDTVQTVVSHEERDDAFDYEHFFLHSAMGTMSRERRARRDSIDSVGSEDSVETTKGPEAPKLSPKEAPPVSYKDQLKPTIGHKRQQSADTVSTMATFATARESFGNDDDDDEDEVDGIDEEDVSDYDMSGVFPLISPEINTMQSPPTLPDEYEHTPHTRTSSIITPQVIRDSYKAQIEDQRPPNHRPSVSSFTSINSYKSNNSTGTTRSFPLVNRPKTSNSVSNSSNPSSTGTAYSAPPRSVRDANGIELPGMALTTDTDTEDDPGFNDCGVYDRGSEGRGEDRGSSQPSPVGMLRRDEQILVERLVASMGKCVLALQESREGTVDHRLWRRRLDAARRVLEGIEGAV